MDGKTASPFPWLLLKGLLVAAMCVQSCGSVAQHPLPLDPVLPVDPNRPPGYPVRGIKHSNPTTVSVGSVLDSNEAKETFLKVSKEAGFVHK